jgi:norsolorinic acid ketoreductase
MSDPTSESLLSLPTADGSKVIPVVIDSNNESSAKEAVDVLQTQYGITKIDVLIANAGISKYYGLATTTPISEIREHFEVNVVGTFSIFQAAWQLLEASSHPIFMALSTGVASIGDMESIPLPSTAYGISKIAVNYMVRKIHFENPKLTAFVMSPGSVICESCFEPNLIFVLR